MGRIKSIDTTPEKNFRLMLWHKGYRYRKNYKELPGKPDIVFIKKKIAIFIDGEFWHGFEWEKKKQNIKVNREYWVKKIEGNIERDKRNNQLLEEKGWKVIRFWMHELNKNPKMCIYEVQKEL